MSSKINPLGNQQDGLPELSHFRKSKDNDKADMQDKVAEITDNSTAYVVVNKSNKTHREINIEIDIFERTAVFSNDFTMWI